MKYYGVTRSTDHLAHYGVKGMKWGVRKAILTGNQRALDRHYRKAAKKLAKLTDIGVNSKKYAAKSAAYGAAAAGTGTLAVGGTPLASNIIRYANKKGLGGLASFLNKKETYNLLNNSKNPENYLKYFRARKKVEALQEKVGSFAGKVDSFGEKEYIKPTTTVRWESYVPKGSTTGISHLRKIEEKKGISIKGNDLYRAGAGLVTAGLAAKSAQNAYRASHGAKYRAKAKAWKNEMDSAFKGTQYEGRYDRPKRRRRKR